MPDEIPGVLLREPRADMASLPTNLKIKHVLQSNVFLILFLYDLYFVGIPRYCNPRSNRFSVLRFPGFNLSTLFKPENKMSPGSSKFESRELRAIVEEAYLFKERTILFLG